MAATFDQSFCNKIAELCYSKYDTLPKNGKPNDRQWTLLAAIVKVNGWGIDPVFEVISAGTGSKCVGQSKMSSTRLNDCHAEVMARRGFLRYLYYQVFQQLHTGKSALFSGTDHEGRCIMKDDITFHFFTSHVPCGDASIFPKFDDYSDGTCTLPINISFSHALKEVSKMQDANANKHLSKNTVSKEAETVFQTNDGVESDVSQASCSHNHLPTREGLFVKQLNTDSEVQLPRTVRLQEITGEECKTAVHCGNEVKFTVIEPSELHSVSPHTHTNSTDENYKCSGLKRASEHEENLSPLSKKPAFSDVYRTGSKCLPGEKLQDPKLPGANYHVTGVLRGKPGRGERSLSLSCSDKLARWAAVGLQGALLSLLLHAPIYYKTLNIGGSSPYSYDALHRAVVGRTTGVVGLKPPYGLSSPIFLHSTLPFSDARQPGKLPCAESIVWSAVPDRPLEVAVNGIKKGTTKKSEKLHSTCCLMICKKELLCQFMHCTHVINGVDISNMTYAQIKGMAEHYRAAWNIVQKTCFPAWPRKPTELSSFTAGE
ncbi:tRNA-specific adenosine deaminase 1 [Schistocerca serialis cubense]|uniref:tRNA-specific adenosine deaminase 1 n=1 Tax=Schistocerca serialis cubense TaxID=2023355 RepID=UPI00214E2363|nr:tRNA-specific adenosine deaminase 1 [Schistocerca serialis cubense]